MEWGLVTDSRLSVRSSTLGAVTLPAGPSSNAGAKHRDRYSRYGIDEGDRDMACRDAVLLLGHLLLCLWHFTAMRCHHLQL